MTAGLALLLVLAAPWWDDWPTTVQTSDPEVAAAVNAASVLCGAADDPFWGLLATRVRYLSTASKVAALQQQNRRLLSWIETFGTTQAYLAELRRGPEGGLLGCDGDPTTPRVFVNHWGWQVFTPRPESFVTWLGPPEYYDDTPWTRPWTRTHPRYGAPPFTYPDGRPATGYLREGDPTSARIYDAGGSKNVLGELHLDYGFNAAAQECRGRDRLLPVPGPGGVRYAGLFSLGKDFCCPHWVAYARATARHLVACGMGGVWADNFSAWDAIGNPPVAHAFGDWSVARFRDHLARRGVTVAADFDVRAYLRGVQTTTMAGRDTDLRDPAWRDPRWLDDPLWREYRQFKWEAGRAALQAFHDALHEAAREGGVSDFAIQGNDIPAFSLGLPRPESLEMVSTEFSPGWNLLAGPRGLGLPPRGRLAPVVKMARVHARSRFVHLWYYLDGEAERAQGQADLGLALSYELLANHAMIQAYPGNRRVAGTNATHREINDVVAALKPQWGDRRPAARIGLVYSPESQLAALTPGGTVDFGAQRHTFDLLGWGTLLTERHQQYHVIAEWDLAAGRLDGVAVLLLPTVEVLAPRTVTEVLAPWVRAGGTLVLSGANGGRLDHQRAHERVTTAGPLSPELARLAGLPDGRAQPAEGDQAVGQGRVIWLPAAGYDYYRVPPAERDLPALPRVDAALAAAGVVGEGLPRELEVTVFGSRTRAVTFVDLANLDLDPDRERAPRPHTVTLDLTLPGQAEGDLQAHLTAPTDLLLGRRLWAQSAVPVTRQGSRLRVGPVPVNRYASLALTGWRLSAESLR